MCVWIFKFGPKLINRTVISEKVNIEKCAYNSLSSHLWLSKWTCTKILELYRINKFYMFTLGHPIVKIEGKGKWRMNGRKNMGMGITVFF